MRYRWRGPDYRRRGREPKQVANAHEDFVDLSPASEAPAEQTRTNWSALLPDQDIPLIWEEHRG